MADDEAMVRAAVRAILAPAPDIEVAAETGDGREALELIGAHRLDVARLDLGRGDGQGLRDGRLVRATDPRMARADSLE